MVVIGGGPAGLEAARVSAERGHKVVLFEAANKFGGQILLGACGSWRRDLMGIVDWRVAELRRLGAACTPTPTWTRRIWALNPDVVILATGGLPQIDLSHGNELCHSTWDVLTGRGILAGDVLVYDGTGRHPGPLAAERIRDTGATVRYVSIDAQLAEELTYAERWRWKSVLLNRGIQPVTETRLVGVDAATTVCSPRSSTRFPRQSQVLVDHVVSSRAACRWRRSIRRCAGSPPTTA